jgi:hypothetical protein
MAFDMTHLPAELHRKIEAMRKAGYEAAAQFANLSDKDLATSAKFWLAHCRAPKLIEPGVPVYDSTFWHAIVPEMIRRLEHSAHGEKPFFTETKE